MNAVTPTPRFSAADILTVANGVCGFLALAVVARLWVIGPGNRLGHRELVACLLLYGIGMVCDVLDGPVARWRGSSGLGPGLDTICDSISFGLLPAMLLVARLHEARGWTAPALAAAATYVGAVMLRLAREASIGQTRREQTPAGSGHAQFTGMPAPVGGNCVLAIVVLAPPAVVALAVVVLVAALLVADFPYPNDKTVVGAAFVAALLVASFAGLAGLISLDIPSAAALAGLLPIALLRGARRLLHGQ